MPEPVLLYSLMTLKSGLYIIENRGKLVGRSLAEDHSLHPKTIFANTDGHNTKWRVEHLGDHKYKLFAIGSVTGVDKGVVVAFLLEEQQKEKAEKWIITARPHSGANLYSIETESKHAGWVVVSEEKSPVRVRPLIVGPSLPPYYPPTELFEFIRLDRED